MEKKKRGCLIAALILGFVLFSIIINYVESNFDPMTTFYFSILVLVLVIFLLMSGGRN